MNNKTFIVATVVLIAIAIIANMPAKIDSGSQVKMADFPMVIGEWQGTDIPLAERDYQILETKNLIMREYKNPSGDAVYLYLVYSEENRRTLHPPEVCYTGGGATIVEKSVVPVMPSFKANKFIVERKDSRHLVVYWFKSTSLNTYNYLRQQLKIVADRLLRKKTSGALIRVSADVKDGKDEQAFALVQNFCGQIYPLLDKYVP